MHISELSEAEEPARDLLVRLGYTFVPRVILAAERDDERKVLLEGRLMTALMRLNPFLTGEQASQVVFKLRAIEETGIARNKTVHEYLTYGMPLDIDEPGGRRTRTVRFFDFDDPGPEAGQNEFIVTTQMRVRRGNVRGGGSNEDDTLVVKPDLVLFVNGIPLVVIEAKSASLIGDVWRTNAVKQLRRYQEADPSWHGRGAPELFDYNLICAAICGSDAAYGSWGSPEGAYATWKSTEPYSGAQVVQRFHVEPEGQARLIIGLLAPATLLDILRDYVVFEPDGGRTVKKLPRYQQYRAVTTAVERILSKTTPQERGGVVWHTQGSGKSLTMLWLALKLRRQAELNNPTIVVVTDRKQLDRQITATFENCNFPSPERAASTRGLRQLLSTGRGRTVMTTIQKFEDALSAPTGELDVLNAADNLFVIVDEAHRTQYGLLGAKMARALPNATFIGFTGTPIDKGFRRSTMGRFGPLIDQYSIPQSVEDGATVPIYYEARLPELSVQGPEALDRLFDALFGHEPDETRLQIKRRYANAESLAEADQRIEQIALDIATHFTTHIRPNGFKAQVVAPNRISAIRYAEKLNGFTQFGIAAYPIITTSANDPVEFNHARDLDQESVIEAFKDPRGEPQILVVVDMLLTGFDAPPEQVLYLDRPLKEHNLLQAIARVNRRATLVNDDGVVTEKQYGLIVDYWGVSSHLDDALSSFDEMDTQGALTPLETDPATVIDAVATQAESWFRGVDIRNVQDCVLVFAPDANTQGVFKADVFERFNADYRAFASLMDRFLPDPRALPYADRLARLTVIRDVARRRYLADNLGIDWDAVSAKVKKLIDSRIDASVRELMKPVSIFDGDFAARIEGLPHDEARASVMEHTLRAQIKERIAENPAFYERLSQQLERIIDDMRRRVIDAAEACKRMNAVVIGVRNTAALAQEAGLGEVSFAVYQLLEQAETSPGEPFSDSSLREEPATYRAVVDDRLKASATTIENIISAGQGVIDWQQNEDVLRVMRRDIKRELRTALVLSEESLNELVGYVVDIARHKAVG